MPNKKKSAAEVTYDPTYYRNVDLDIHSRLSLKGLVDALGDGAFVLYVGGEGQEHQAHVELASSHMGMSADRAIVGLVKLINRLPVRYRRIWDGARSREFNVGIEAGLTPHSFELRLRRPTLDAIASVGGALVVTVYAPTLEVVSRNHS